jgi:cyclopropane fatty-acyl-phospholipid synthase-like methyltransferase
MHVLDVGCGTGNALKIYLNEGCNLYGIDPFTQTDLKQNENSWGR